MQRLTKARKGSPVVDGGDSLLHEGSGFRAVQGGGECGPELWPGQFLAVACSPAPEQPQAGMADYFMAAHANLLLLLLSQNTGHVNMV